METDLTKNLLYIYTQFVQNNRIEPNAWVMNPHTWQQTRAQLRWYPPGLQPLHFSWGGQPANLAVSERPEDPPMLFNLPVICSLGIAEGSILAARIETA